MSKFLFQPVTLLTFFSGTALTWLSKNNFYLNLGAGTLFNRLDSISERFNIKEYMTRYSQTTFFQSMGPKEKKRFDEMADRDKQRYQREMEAYIPPKGQKKVMKRKKDPNAPKRSW